jgi:hypothetical protein
MEMTRRCRSVVGALLVGVNLTLASGCQTWIGGQTLPSGDYLRDNPDFIPKGPNFPLQRELDNQKAAAKTLEGATP